MLVHVMGLIRIKFVVVSRFCINYSLFREYHVEELSTCFKTVELYLRLCCNDLKLLSILHE